MGLLEEAQKIKEDKAAFSLDNGRLVVKDRKLDADQNALLDGLSIKKAEEKEAGNGKDSNGTPRLQTGIPGLDEVMEGGLKKGTVNLIGGGAGCGKSIFCMQFLVKGIEECNENGVFITFEESEEKIIDNFKRFHWNLAEKAAKKQLIILHYTPEQVQTVIESGGGAVRDVIESVKAKRVVIDSLTAFTLLQNTELAKRRAVLQLIEAIKNWGCTAMVTSEQEPDPDKHQSTIIEFEVDGVILLYNIRKGDIRERSLEIFKMRGTKHAAKIFPMKIDDSGIVIYPDETVF